MTPFLKHFTCHIQLFNIREKHIFRWTKTKVVMILEEKNYSKQLQRTILYDLLNLNPYITQETLLQSQHGK